ncbi:unnamed protein product, partial [Mesorhabditis spiculigera]
MTTEYDKLLLNFLTGGTTSLAIALGRKLGLFEVLFEISSDAHHVSPEELAQKANCKPRYVREWCACLACAGIFQVDDEEKYWLTEDQKKSLQGNALVPMFSMIPLFSDGREKLQEAFDASNPRLGMDYSDFSTFYELMAQISTNAHDKVVIPKLLPEIGHGIVEKLVAGNMKSLDVGCGIGFHVQMLAKAYPKSHFTGLDLTASAIETANKRKLDEKTENAEYIQCNAASMPENWADSFDFVTIFDACHDQTRPDLCLKEIHRVLKPGGLFAMIEIKGTSHVAKDKAANPLLSSVFYGCSMFHCLPVGSNLPDALCLGAMWGQERAQNLMKQSGFSSIDTLTPDYLSVNNVYIAKK